MLLNTLLKKKSALINKWYRLPESIMIRFPEAYVRHQAWINKHSN